MVVTPAWSMTSWAGPIRIFASTWAAIDRILILDTGLNPLTDDEILEVSALIQVHLNFETCDLDHF